MLELCPTCCHVSWIKAVGQSFGGAPLGADHHVVSGLVPEVVPKGCSFAWMLPVPDHLESLTVQQDEPPLEEDGGLRCVHQEEPWPVTSTFLTFAVASWVSQTADHDLAVAQTVGGVRVGKATFPEQVHWFHHLKTPEQIHEDQNLV